MRKIKKLVEDLDKAINESRKPTRSLKEAKKWFKVTDAETAEVFKKGTKWHVVDMFGYKNPSQVGGDFKCKNGTSYHLMWDKTTDEVFVYDDEPTNEAFEGEEPKKEFYLYAGYYELIISGHELEGPYVYQFKADNLDDIYDYLEENFSDGDGGFTGNLIFTKDIEKDVRDLGIFAADEESNEFINL